ncbi:MAG: type I 3-dehydroquinate dehydratase [Phycisphaerales bacterium]|nr:type I 3-dehydroquinate dehydratase [Phycisphaerales bacterium]
MSTSYFRTLLCVPLTAPGIGETLDLLHDPKRFFDVAELRLDYLERPDVARLLRDKPCPVIVTNRPTREGGHWAGDETRRLELLAEADRLGADYIDIEWDAREHFGHPGQARLIVSRHYFQETPAEIAEIARQIEDTDADVVKIATRANTPADNVAMLRVLRAARKPTIAVTMGEHGNLPRILGPKENAFLVYASLGTGLESAPGQVPIDEFVDIFRFREIRPATRCFGILGNPAPHPVYAALLNRAFRHLAVDAVALPIRTENPAEVLHAYQEVPMAGYMILPPLQTKMADLTNASHSRMTGFVDTLVMRDERLEGCHLHPCPDAMSPTSQLPSDTNILVKYLAAVFEFWTDRPAPYEYMHTITSI